MGSNGARSRPSHAEVYVQVLVPRVPDVATPTSAATADVCPVSQMRLCAGDPGRRPGGSRSAWHDCSWRALATVRMLVNPEVAGGSRSRIAADGGV